MEILLWPNTWQVVYKEGCNFLDGEIGSLWSPNSQFKLQNGAQRPTLWLAILMNPVGFYWHTCTPEKTIPAICQRFKATHNFGDRIHLFVFSYISDKKTLHTKSIVQQNILPFLRPEMSNYWEQLNLLCLIYACSIHVTAQIRGS